MTQGLATQDQNDKDSQNLGRQRKCQKKKKKEGKGEGGIAAFPALAPATIQNRMEAETPATFMQRRQHPRGA